MKLVVGILVVALAVPILLIVAVALGPVTLAAISAIGFGIVIFAIWNLLVALGVVVSRAAERATGHHRR